MPLDVPELGTSNMQLAKAFDKIGHLEQKSLAKFDEKIQKVDTQLKLVGDLKGRFAKIKEALTPFRTPGDFRELKGTSSAPGILDVSAIDKTKADVGTYEFEVLNLANTNSIMTYGYGDRDKSEVGVGYISFKTPAGETREVYINSDNNTLDGVAGAINAAKLGVKAYVVNDGTDADEPWRLVIAGEGTGWKQNFEWPEFYLVDGDMEFDKERVREAKSAIIRFNGQPMMADENTLNNLLPGVNIDLKDAAPGKTIKLDIKPNIEVIKERAKGFVDGMNGVLSFIQSQNALGPDSAKDPSKALGGDVGLKAIESRMRNVIQLTTNERPSTVTRLRDVGIVFNRNGTLDYDGEKFQKALVDDFDGVASFFAGSSPLTGFANEMISLVDGAIRRGDGLVSIKEASLKERMGKAEKDRDTATDRAQKRLEKIKSQFVRADAAMADMAMQKGALPQGG
ncbi:MAG: flagellar filament capping protein FliD [Bdellovibrionota bacterium]